jgi:hypothetical protein
MEEETRKAGKSNNGTNCFQRNFVRGGSGTRNGACMLPVAVVTGLVTTSSFMGR